MPRAATLLSALALGALLLLLATAEAVPQTASCYYNGATHAYSVKFGVLDAAAAAVAKYDDAINATGWMSLHVETNAAFDDLVQAYAAGYVEGALTHVRVYMTLMNALDDAFGKSKMDPKVYAWLQRQDKWTEQQIAAHAATDDFWHVAAIFQAQYHGLVDGSNAFLAANEQIDPIVLQIVNAGGDVTDVISIVEPELRPSIERMSAIELRRYRQRHGRCSAVIRLPADFQDVMFSHATWWSYESLTGHTYKYYTIRARRGVRAQQVAMSGYAGALSSTDDYYMMGGTGMVTIETSNDILNNSLWDIMTPHGLFVAQRSAIANMMATDAHSWTQIFPRSSSYTYNNQWMILDLKRFTPGAALKSGFFYLLEDAPGIWPVSADMTSWLAGAGYWPSYNLPYFTEIYNHLGYAAAYKKHHDPEDVWGMCARAKIFREHAPTTNKLQDVMHLMRLNEFQTDPYSEGDPGLAIASRFDLDIKDPYPQGAIDAKVSSFSSAPALTTYAISGPTAQTQPVFCWSQGFDKFLHLGLPDCLTADKGWGWQTFSREALL